MELKEVRLKDIKPYPGNPRKNDAAVDAVAESIKQCGYVAPIIVDENMVILAGHTRYKALKRLGWKEAQIGIAEGLSEEQKRKYRVLDNKTNEFAEWDLDKLLDELDGLDFDGFDFGFGDLDFEDEERDKSDRFFEDKDAYDSDREQDDEYDEFLEKFEAKHTTDDCYTPDVVYDAVADWVAEKYGLDRKNFVRPFYPGGNYQQYKYKRDDVVVDNPPFSIESEIVQWYIDHGIKFYLFAPGLTICSTIGDKDATAICVNVQIVYENKAIVGTSFITNMEDGIRAKSEPELYKIVNDAVSEFTSEFTKELPKYKYPDEAVTAAMLSKYSKYGVGFAVDSNRSEFVRKLDSQADMGKAMFGAGMIVSEKTAAEKAVAEKAAAEKAAAHVWELSEREKQIVRRLSEADVV